MTVAEIFGLSGGGLIVLLTLLQIAPIKVNPWSALMRAIGRSVNAEIMGEMKTLGNKMECTENKINDLRAYVNAMRDETMENFATNYRVRILRFADEEYAGVPHTKEHFDQIMLDMDKYEQYCESHPGYKNNIASSAIEQIKALYQKHLVDRDFFIASPENVR